MNPTIAWMTVRGLLGRRRVLMLLPLPVLLVTLAAAARYAGISPEKWVGPVLLSLGLGAVLPIVALVVGTGVLGSEIDDGTVVHILTKPLPRREIIFAKLLVAVAVTGVTVAVPVFVTGLLADSVAFGLALAAGSVVGAVAYCSLFLALSLVTRRPVLLGLLYVLIWENVLTGLIPGTQVLSIREYVITAAERITPTDLLTGQVSPVTVLVMVAVFTIGGTMLSIDRLRSFSMAGETS